MSSRLLLTLQVPGRQHEAENGVRLAMDQIETELGAFDNEGAFTETRLLVVEKMTNQQPVRASHRAEQSRHVRPSYRPATGP